MITRPLTKEEKHLIYQVILKKTNPDDRDSNEVIREDFDGNEEAYLKAMATMHHIHLEE